MTAYERWKDYTTFHVAAIRSRDIDPVYPVLHQVAVDQELDGERLLRTILLHVAYYDMGSALTAASLHIADDVPISRLPSDLPCATERRNHRQPPKLTAHLTDLEAQIRIHGSATAWLAEALITGRPEDDFEHLAKHVAAVYGNGRWASYKTAEMVWKVAGWPLHAATLAMDDASGPKQGLAILQPTGPHNEAAAQRLVTTLAQHDLPAAPEEIETTLCDFHALVRGHYYVGHDIDQMQQQLSRAEPQTELHVAAWKARNKTIPNQYLGELNGWAGTDRERKRLYRDTGIIALRGAP